jgi:hypothetical protein
VKTKPPRPNVPALIKLHKVSVWKDQGGWSAQLKHDGTFYGADLFPSKRKAVLGVIELAGLPLLQKPS